jgi:glucokinase
MRVVAADVGGTKTLVALYEGEPGAFAEVASRRYQSDAYEGLAPIVADFLGEGVRSVAAAAIGVAGPVIDDTCKTTNLPWQMDARRIEADLGIARVRLLNDFEAVALGLGELSASQLDVLQDRPVDPDSPSAVLGAGTGLGEAIIVPSERPLPRVIATEGGHCDFAPRDEVEIELLRFLLRRHKRVSYERVLSGRGLQALYDFVVESELAPTAGATRALLDAADDRAAVIGECALTRSDEACVRAASMFVSVYGAEAGNLALKTLPRGGLFVAGGIAPKLIEIIRAGEFMRAFLAKGRMGQVLDTIRVSVVLEQRVGLLGARRAAVSTALPC